MNENLQQSVIEHLFDPDTAKLANSYGLEYQRKVMASIPQDIDDTDLVQINWMKAKNVPLMEMVGSIETPFLMLNPNVPSTLVERYFDNLQEGEEGIKLITEKGNENVRREVLVNKVLLDDDVDWGVVEATQNIPLDNRTRSYILSINVDIVREYLQKNPDKLKGGEKYPDIIADSIIQTLLEGEEFFGDEDDLDDIAEYKDQLRSVERTEIDVLSDYRNRFPTYSLEHLVKSINDTTRSKLACIDGLSKKTQMVLAKDKNLVRRNLAKCTFDCDVLKFLRDDKGSTKTTIEAAVKRMTKLKC